MVCLKAYITRWSPFIGLKILSQTLSMLAVPPGTSPRIGTPKVLIFLIKSHVNYDNAQDLHLLGLTYTPTIQCWNA